MWGIFLEAKPLSLPRDLNKVALATAVAATSLTVHLPSYAQAALEEVVVTARKREESMQEVPIAVSAFSGDALKSLGVANVKELEGIVPGLNMGGGGNGVKGDSNPYIRGVGQRETKVTVDGAVGTYIDGVYLGRAAGALVDALDVQSIEVLRGPQGTLFGKNSTGGAINITTQKPGPDFGGHMDVTVGNYGRRNAALGLNVPLIEDKLYGRLTMASVKSDGFFENQGYFDAEHWRNSGGSSSPAVPGDLTKPVSNGTNWGDDDRLTGVGQLRWDASESVQVDLLYAWTKTRQHPRPQRCNYLADDLDSQGNAFVGNYNNSLNSTHGANNGVSYQSICEQDDSLDTNEFRSELSSNSSTFDEAVYEVNTETLAATVLWDVGYFAGVEDFMVKSISAWRLTEQRADEDLDGSGASFLGRVQPDFNETNQYSQEFQFTGSVMDGRLRLTSGVFYFLEQTDNDTLRSYGGLVDGTVTNGGVGTVSAGQATISTRETQNESIAWYGQGDFAITENIELTFGLRYTWEERYTAYSEGMVDPTSWCQSGAVNPDPSEAINGNPTAPTYSVECNPSSVAGITHINSWTYGILAPEPNQGTFIPGALSSETGSRIDEAWTPMVSLKYLVPADVLESLALDSGMVFFTYSQGFRSGGLVGGVEDDNQISPQEGGGRLSRSECPSCDLNWVSELSEFDPEFVTNYEMGFKADLFDSRLRTNFAAYYMDYEDIQVTSVRPKFGVPQPFVENAGKAEIWGAEAEVIYVPLESVRITTSLAYTNADYVEYIVEATERGGDPEIIDRADEDMPRVPELTAFLALDYFWVTDGWGVINPQVSAKYTDEIYNGFDRDSWLVKEYHTAEATTFYSARLAWELPDDRTVVTLWGKNLTDVDDYNVGGIPLVSVSGSTGVVYGDPRTFGLDITHRFGD